MRSHLPWLVALMIGAMVWVFPSAVAAQLRRGMDATDAAEVLERGGAIDVTTYITQRAATDRPASGPSDESWFWLSHYGWIRLRADSHRITSIARFSNLPKASDLELESDLVDRLDLVELDIDKTSLNLTTPVEYAHRALIDHGAARTCGVGSQPHGQFRRDGKDVVNIGAMYRLNNGAALWMRVMLTVTASDTSAEITGYELGETGRGFRGWDDWSRQERTLLVEMTIDRPPTIGKFWARRAVLHVMLAWSALSALVVGVCWGRAAWKAHALRWVVLIQTIAAVTISFLLAMSEGFHMQPWVFH